MTKNKDIRPIDIDKIDLERLKQQTTDLPSLLQFAHDRSSALINPEDQGKIKARALLAMQEQTKREFDQILNLIQPLMEQAEKLKKRVLVSELIYMAQIPFDPIIGQNYFVYKKADGQTTLSLISPSEWGAKMPFASFEGEVKLLSDHTWELVE